MCSSVINGTDLSMNGYSIVIIAGDVFLSLACISNSFLCSSLAFFICTSYSSSHFLVVMINPSFSNPFSIFTTVLLLTSPDPVPPLIVFREEFPKRATFPAFANGRILLFLSKTAASPTIYLTFSLFVIIELERILIFGEIKSDIERLVLKS